MIFDNKNVRYTYEWVDYVSYLSEVQLNTYFAMVELKIELDPRKVRQCGRYKT